MAKKKILLAGVVVFAVISAAAILVFLNPKDAGKKQAAIDQIKTESKQEPDKGGEEEAAKAVFGNGAKTDNDKDADKDGISDWIEKELGLDPSSPDTDKDGVDDLTEIKDGTNPKNRNSFAAEHQKEILEIKKEMPLYIPPKDSDKDGLSDEEEVKMGTDPNNMDTDKDGLIDSAESSRFFKTDPLNPDSDGDGFLDGQEIFDGYDPLQPNTALEADAPPPNSVGGN